MKIFKILLLVLLISDIISAQEFIRNLPDEKLQEILTPQNFRNMDAVIIVKEQSFLIQERSIERADVEYTGPSITKTGILIVKLFNELAVKRYGTFEYEYLEYFGDEFPNGFEAHVRVLKPDGEIWTMPKDDVYINVSRRSGDGQPLARKALFKIPNLAIGDILQIEFIFTENFSYTTSGVFYYNDKDFILYSNLYVTLPFKWKARYISFSEERIGAPQIQQVSKSFGAGKTYFWSVRDLNSIPQEPYSFPFSDQSLMTAFLVERTGNSRKKYGTWEDLAKNFYESHIKKGSVDDKYIEELGFSKNEKDTGIDFKKVDQLYKALRGKIALQKKNSLYPINDVKSVIESGTGDASDVSFIMYKILKKWDQSVHIVWIRDQREGRFENTVPTTIWFDRLGVLVEINREERLYDFDCCIPNEYAIPWFLKPINIIVIHKDGFINKTINSPSKLSDNVQEEFHTLEMDNSSKFMDTMQLSYKGAFANKFRNINYRLEDDDLIKKIDNKITEQCLFSVDNISYNNYNNEIDVSISAKGLSATKIDTIDSFLTIKLKNYFLNEFKENFNSLNRRGHIDFKFPFQLKMNWKIKIPEGYKLKNILKDKVLHGPAEIRSHFKFVNNGNELDISVKILFPQKEVHVNNYGKIFTLLNETLAVLNQDIFFKKL